MGSFAQSPSCFGSDARLARRKARAMSQWGGLWLVCAFQAGCGGNTISVIETTNDPGQGGSPSPVSPDGTCWAPEDCGAERVCHPDGQCHPKPAMCEQRACGTDENGDCACQWTCTDQHAYQTRCRMTYTGLVICNCGVDDVEFPWTCVVEEKTTDVCGMGTVCCVFPVNTHGAW